MNADIYAVCNEVTGALAGGIVQGLAVFALVWMVLKFFRNATAATRHAVWFTTLLVVAALPFANLLFLIEIESPKTFEFAGPLPEPVSVAVAEPVWESESNRNWEVSAPAPLGIAVLASWAMLALIRFAGLGRQLLLLRMIKRQATPAAPLLATAFSATAADLGIKRNVRLLVSREIAAPMAVGFFKPAVILPHAVATESTDAQMGCVLRHELAHFARRDDWANLIQQSIAALFFFHPGILFLSRRLTREREIACDDHALAALQAPRDYALFLTEFASRMKGRDFTAAPAAWSSNSQLKERIGMILDIKRNASPRTSRAGVGLIAATTLLLAIAALTAAPRVVFAAEKPEPPAVPVPPAAPTVSIEPVQVETEISVSAAPAVASIVHVQTPGVPKLSLTAPAPVPAPRPKYVATTDSIPKPEPKPRVKIERAGGDGDLERRLERVERMLESLTGREKGPKIKSDFNLDFKGPEFHGLEKKEMEKMNRDIERGVERARRDADRAKRDVERAVKEIDVEKIHRQAHQAAQAASSAQAAQGPAKMQIDGAREALRAQRKALAAQRNALDQQIQALREKENAEREREYREKEKEKNKEDKGDKKSRASNDNDNSNNNSNDENPKK